ncbi:MAG: acyl-CoA dehydrogenase [Candidatus Paceibacteria bacterium]|jgi:acyl-CoA dehydrogenase
MEFLFSEEHEMLRDAVREFADGVIRPIADEIDKQHAIPREVIDQMAELGLLGVAIPEQYGGAGMGETGLCIVMEELTRADFSVAVTLGAHASIGAMSVVVGGTDEQKERFLPGFASGETLACYALTESGAGSDPGAMKTSAVRDGDDWILNGEKVWITAGDIADLAVVYAVTDKEKGASGGVTSFLVPRESEGYQIGNHEEKMGQRGSGTVTLAFDNVRVPDSNRLGEVGLGFRTAMGVLDRGRLALGANCLGCAREAHMLSVDYAKQREAFGRPISSFQAMQWMLADSAVDIFSMESMIYRTAWLCDTGQDFAREAAMVKLSASEAVCRVVDRAVQIHGGMGYSAEYKIERLYRDARVTRIYEGTNEIQRLVVARDVIKRGF